MNDKQLIQKTEAYVKEVMSNQTPSMAIAHDFKHVDRVRNWRVSGLDSNIQSQRREGNDGKDDAAPAKR